MLSAPWLQAECDLPQQTVTTVLPTMINSTLELSATLSPPSLPSLTCFYPVFCLVWNSTVSKRKPMGSKERTVGTFSFKIPLPPSLLLFLCFVFWDGFLCIVSPVCAGTHSADQVGLELRDSPTSASCCAGIQVFNTTAFCVLVGRSLSLGTGFEVLKAHAFPVFLIFLAASS